jgi:hypothetical protein
VRLDALQARIALHEEGFVEAVLNVAAQLSEDEVVDPSIRLKKYVTSPDAAAPRHLNDASNPVACSDSRFGSPFSNALFPACGP